MRHLGLSNVSIVQIEAARKVLDVATVQNGYNLADQTDEDVLDYFEREGIGFMPWFPRASGELSKPDGVLGEIADSGHKHGCPPPGERRGGGRDVDRRRVRAAGRSGERSGEVGREMSCSNSCRCVAVEGCGELVARVDVELGEHLAQVVLDGARAEEQSCADVRV